MSRTLELPAKPIGVIASLSAGLDTVIQGWWVLLFPVALDLFLWLGPRLSIQPVVDRALSNLAPLMANTPALELLREAAGEFNYLSTLSVAPLGVPSVMSVKLPQTTPFGQPAVYQVESDWVWLALFAGLSLAGLLLGGIYLGLIAHQVRDGAPRFRGLLRVVPRYWLSILILVAALAILAVTIGTPVLVAATLFSGLSVWIATLIVWVGFLLFLWLVFHLAFTVHCLLLSELPLPRAVWTSLRLVAFNAFSVMGLFALAAAISAGLNYVWSLPSEGSWMTLLGIAGHAVISSGLVAATFVFYQDRYRYWQQVRDYFAKVAEQESVES